jgi:aminoglycoside phosphotransferase (APT) family kinase protein
MMTSVEGHTAGASPPGLWREPPDPRSVLQAANVASVEALSAAQTEDLSRSHTLTFVELPDGSAYVVKSLSRHAVAAGRSLAAELYTYRLSEWHPGLAAVLPRPVHLDERREVIALAAAPREQLASAQDWHAGFPSIDIAAALGSTLAVVHGVTRTVPLMTLASCGILALPDTPEEQRHIGNDSAAGLAAARAVAADAFLAASLRRTAAAWQPSCLIHADLKWDNIALVPGPPAQVQIFDWELSGHGDPAWDVGSALADTVSLMVRWSGRAAIPGHPSAWLSVALRALIAAYARAARPPAGFADRIVGCWTARMIHLALECAVALDDPMHGTVDDQLAAVRTLAARHDDVVRAVDRVIAAEA